MPQEQVMKAAREVVAERGWDINARTHDHLDVSWRVGMTNAFRNLSIRAQPMDSGGTLVTVRGDSRGLLDLRLMRRAAADLVTTLQTDLE